MSPDLRYAGMNANPTESIVESLHHTLHSLSNHSSSDQDSRDIHNIFLIFLGF